MKTTIKICKGFGENFGFLFYFSTTSILVGFEIQDIERERCLRP